MTKREILLTPIGEMRDMIACMAIYHGAKPRKRERRYSFEETLSIL